MSDEIELEDNVDNSQAEIDFEKAFDSDEEDIQEDDKTQDQDDSKDQVKNNKEEDSEDDDQDDDQEEDDSDDDDQEDDDDDQEDDEDDDVDDQIKKRSDELKNDLKNKNSSNDDQDEDDEEEDEEDLEPVNLDSIVSGLGEDKSKEIISMFDDFPEMKDLMNAIVDTLNPQKQQEIKVSQEKQEQLDNSRFWARVLVENPDAKEIASSDKFYNWLDKQDLGIQAMANSLNKDDAILVLKAYDSFEKNSAKKQAEAKKVRKKKTNLHKTTLKSGKTTKKSSSGVQDFESAFYEAD